MLCRILTELKLLRTSVGTIVLSAGVGNDVVGWILLALCVALVNAGSGLTALWVFLTCTGFVLLVVFVVRPAFLWVLRRTGSLHNGPTPGVMTLTLLMVFISAWFTNIIGVHPIFGGFLVGLICPHDGGFAIKLTEKIEDLVTVFFLPLYFALSGLNTNLGLLDNGITWGYVIGVLAVAFFGKIVGGTIAARLCKLVWRESLTIGVLMSCKGLVELIVLVSPSPRAPPASGEPLLLLLLRLLLALANALRRQNIGLQAQILSTRTFTIFVVMAVVTTFATTPMTSYLYPPWYQKKLEAWKRGEIDWDGNRLIETEDGSDRDAVSIEKLQNAHVRRLLVYLRLDSLSGLVTFVGLLGGKNAAGAVHKTHPLRPSAAAAANKAEPAVAEQDGEAADDAPAIVVRKRPVEVHGLRMVELTERTSSIMKVSELDDVRDPVVDVFHTFANLNNVAVSGGVVVVPHDSYAETLTRRASEMSSDLLLVPWGGNGEISEASDALMPQGPDDRFAHGSYHQFLSAVLGDSTCNLAVLVNNGFGGGQGKQAARPSMKRSFSALSLPSAREVPTAPVAERSHHIFFPFFGGPDDRAALRFVLQLAENVNVTVTILMLDRHPTSAPTTVTAPAAAAAAAAALTTEPKTQPSSEGTSVAETQPAAADTALDEDRAFFCSIRDSLPRALEARVVFHTIFTRQPLRDAFARAQTEVGQASRNAGDLVVVGRRSGAEPSTRDELTALLASLGRPSASGSEATHALGDAAEAMIVGKVKASVLVIRAATA